MTDWALKISYLSIYPSLVGNKFEVLQGAQYWNPSSILYTKQNNNQTLTNSSITHSISFTYTHRILRTLKHKNFSSVVASIQIKQWRRKKKKHAHNNSKKYNMHLQEPIQMLGSDNLRTKKSWQNKPLICNLICWKDLLWVPHAPYTLV